MCNSMKERLKKFIIKKQEEIQKGKAVTEQMKAEKQRKKLQKMKYAEPGTFRFGMHYKQNPVEFMKDSYARKKRLREETNNRKGKGSTK